MDITATTPAPSPSDDEAEARWVWALDTGDFSAALATLRATDALRANVTYRRDLTPCGQAIYDQLATCHNLPGGTPCATAAPTAT